MKKQITFIAIALATFGLCISAQAQMDLTVEPRVYLTGSKLSIDQGNDRFVSKNMRVDVFTDQASSFADGYYTFNMGIIARRSGKVAFLWKTYGQFRSTAEWMGNEMKFQPGRVWQHFVQPVKLKSGANRVEVLIDPYQKTIESDETNNTFWINVVVNQRFPSAGPK